MYQVEVITPPATSPLTAAQLRAHLRLNDTSEDSQLDDFIAQAVERFEIDAKRPVLATAYRQYFARWPLCPLVLGRGGVTAVTAVKRYTAAGDIETVTGWRSDVKTPPSRVFFPDGIPAKDYDPAGYVEFAAGWANAGAVPKTVLGALKLLAGHWYENREAYRDSAFELRETPLGWASVCRSYSLGLSGDWGQ